MAESAASATLSSDKVCKFSTYCQKSNLPDQYKISLLACVNVHAHASTCHPICT